MRAAVYHGRGRIALEERPDPVAGPGELVVRVRACGLCGSDLMAWYQDPRAPLVLGHEPAGEVVEAGPGAPFAVGAARVRAPPRPVHDLRPLPGRPPHALRGLPAHPHRPRRPRRADPGAAPRTRAPTSCPFRPRCPTGPRRSWSRSPASSAASAGPASARARGSRSSAPGPWGCSGPRCAGGGRGRGRRGRAATRPPGARRRRGGDGAGRPRPRAVAAALGGGLADQVFVCTSDREAIASALHLAGPGGVVQLFAPTPPGELVGLDLGRPSSAR